MKYVVTIAGSDTIGGAGVQADIRTIFSLGAHALTVITAVTAQNSLGIEAIHNIPAPFISRQLETLLQDLRPDAAKVGMLASAAAVLEVAGAVKRHGLSRLVVDPVLRASAGGDLLEPEALDVLKETLFPLAAVVTPNLDEAEVLTGKRVRSVAEMEAACREIAALGPKVVVTGGHLEGRCVDVFFDGRALRHFSRARIETQHTHGSGCVFSSALATFLAMGHEAGKASKLAHDFTGRAIEAGHPCGRGAGPVRPQPGICLEGRQGKTAYDAVSQGQSGCDHAGDEGGRREGTGG